MKSILMMTTAALALSACTNTTKLCDRDAIAWDKWGESTMPAECERKVTNVISDGTDADGPSPTGTRTISDDTPAPETGTGAPEDTPVGDTNTPDTSDSDDDTDSDGKTDNSDANGKGGNKKDRTDKDTDPQEIAEGKKGV